ncbi:SDR family NAD(P)-dependent oxidoreductase [Nonomuraea sp. NPDC002799]
MELDGLVAVVTGGAAGLGAAIVDALHAEGAQVVYGDLHDRQDKPWSGPVYQRLDVRDRDSWDLLADTVRTTYGRLDILVNNAGVSVRKDLLDTDDADWDRVLRTNLWAPWTGIRTFVGELTASPHASVVNIGSIYGHLPPPPPPAPPSTVAYQVSKAGLHMLTKTAAVELADRGIRVNCVLPGVFITPLLQQLSDEQLRPRIQRAPMGRAGDPADVAVAVTYLASPKASFVTGVLLPVDGGYTAS